MIIRVSSIRAHTRAKAIGFQAYLMQTETDYLGGVAKVGVNRVPSNVDLGPG